MWLGVWLTSLCVLMLELALTRVFSATMYYHFAFLAISLALLGSGASGIAVYAGRNRLAAHPPHRLLALSAGLFSVSVVAALAVTLANPLPLELGPGGLARLTAVYLAGTLPFFWGGAAITLAVTHFARRISVLYLVDLTGAATGCALLIPLLDRVGAVQTVLLVAVLAACASMAFAAAGPAKGTRRAAFALTLAATTLLVVNPSAGWLDLGGGKDRGEEDVLFSRWNSFSRVTVHGDLSQPTLRIRIDNDALTTVFRDGSNSARYAGARDDLTALPYLLRPGADALIIGSGGGPDVITARVAGARRITAVEVNPLIARNVMGTEPFRSYSGDLYRQPGVRLVVDEGRSFIRGSGATYDVIQATMVDTWAATAAGAFALTENNLYTVEAFRDYLDHLGPGGLVAITRWYLDPPDQILRLLSLGRAVLEERGADEPFRHLAVVASGGEPGSMVPATVLLARDPLGDRDVFELERLALERGFTVLYSPIATEDTLFGRLARAGDPATVWDAHPTDISPTYDNNPFFFNTLRPSRLADVMLGAREWRKTNLGTVVLLVLLLLTLVMVVLFMLGPLVLAGGRAMSRDTRGKLLPVNYFACLGLGFILIEIALVQKLILLLGHPVYALAVVLLTVLAFGGLGSLTTARVGDAELRQALLRRLGLLITVAVVAVATLSPVIQAAVHLPRGARIALTVVLVAPLATLMGMPMPLGIRRLERSQPQILPWAWGVNGAASVLGSALALVIALLSGFNQALLVGVAAYLGALAIAWCWEPADHSAGGAIRAPRAHPMSRR